MNATILSVLGIALIDSINPSALVMTLYLLTQGAFALKVLVYVSAVFLHLPDYRHAAHARDRHPVCHLRGAARWPRRLQRSGRSRALMLSYAVLAPSDPKPKRETQKPEAQTWAAIFLLGVTITFVEFSTAWPYLGAIAVLTGADLTITQWLPLLVLYNLIFVLPPLLLLLAYHLLGRRLQARFDAWRESLRKSTRSTMLWILGIVGFFLLSDSLVYFGVPINLPSVSKGGEGPPRKAAPAVKHHGLLGQQLLRLVTAGRSKRAAEDERLTDTTNTPAIRPTDQVLRCASMKAYFTCFPSKELGRFF
jgi:cytochrome c biogenesis protein CcdA